jgi:hypothetical protein
MEAKGWLKAEWGRVGTRVAEPSSTISPRRDGSNWRRRKQVWDRTSVAIRNVLENT